MGDVTLSAHILTSFVLNDFLGRSIKDVLFDS